MPRGATSGNSTSRHERHCRHVCVSRVARLHPLSWYLCCCVTARGKLLVKILAGTWDQNIPFDELVTLLRYLGFRLRVAGSHHIFVRQGVAEILNLQRRRDGTAKPYQVKQVRQVLVRYRITGEIDDV